MVFNSSWQTSFVKGHRVSILGFVGHSVSITPIQVLTELQIVHKWMDVPAPVKLYKHLARIQGCNWLTPGFASRFLHCPISFILPLILFSGKFKECTICQIIKTLTPRLFSGFPLSWLCSAFQNSLLFPFKDYAFFSKLWFSEYI